MGYSLFVTGLTHKDGRRAFPGCTLYTPMSGDATHLIDIDGREVHAWAAPAGLKAYYATGLDNGNLFLQCIDGTENGGPAGGRAAAALELDWDGNIVWDYRDPRLHHDHHRRANGNTILVAAEMLDRETSARFVEGGDPGTPNGEILSEALIEVAPDGSTVWEWHAHEHLDPAIEKFRLGGGDQWLHCNAVEELPDGNLMASFNTLSEVVIIDRASGDVTWRLKPGTTMSQHNPTMQANGNILMFDNGNRRNFSRVIEVQPDQEIAWEYTGNPRDSFFSMNISGAQRLPNGNTLITEGRSARFFEVTPDKETVWEFISPYTVTHLGQVGRAVFRAHRYAADSGFIRGRV